MSTADLNQALTAPGRLVINPTDKTAAFPYGGTQLGEVREVRTVITGGWFDVEAEEFGGAIVESVWSGENIALGCYLRQFDETAGATVFPNTKTTGTSKRVAITSYNDAASPVRPGHLLSSRGVKLLFVPFDVDRVRCVYFNRALPRTNESMTLQRALGIREEIPALFLAVPKSSSSMLTYQIDFLRDLTL